MFMHEAETLQRPREFEISERDFEFISEFIGTRTGIVLGENKQEMIYGRMARRLRALKMTTFAEYRQLLESPDGAGELPEMINALTTNLTKFFRENHHFQHLGSEVLSRAFKRTRIGRARIRIWSAGCSSGQEPFSIALTIADNVPDFQRHDIKILATDLDSNMVARGRSGRYSSSDIESIRPALRDRWLRPVDGEESIYIFDDSIRAMITFNTLNLLNEWPVRGPFDAIFLRNVIIYFDNDLQRKIIGRIYDLLDDSGFLYLGHSENISRMSDQFANFGKTIHSKISQD